MEQKIRALFDFQKFTKNPRLDALIADTENRYAKELDEDDLSYVSAAGEATIPSKANKGREEAHGKQPVL